MERESRPLRAARLIYDEGWSPDEVAEALGVTRGTALNYAAKGKLRRSQTFPCPCGGEFTTVIDTRPAHGAIRRRRKCDSCDGRATTYERLDPETVGPPVFGEGFHRALAARVEAFFATLK